MKQHIKNKLQDHFNKATYTGSNSDILEKIERDVHIMLLKFNEEHGTCFDHCSFEDCYFNLDNDVFVQVAVVEDGEWGCISARYYTNIPPEPTLEPIKTFEVEGA